MKPPSVSVGRPVTASDVLLKVVLADAPIFSVSPVPLNVPPPVQPVMLNVFPPTARVGQIGRRELAQYQRHPVGRRQQPIAQREALLLLAVTVSTVAPLSISEPFPVQPPTVKTWSPVVSVRLAVPKPFKVSVAPLVTASDVLPSVTAADTIRRQRLRASRSTCLYPSSPSP